MSFIISSEVGQLSLDADGNLVSDVCHLQSLLSQVPLIPMIVGFDMLFDKVSRSLCILVDHER